MPMFNWQAGLIDQADAHIVNPRFWIYWAVTIPLTVALIVIWRIYATCTQGPKEEGVEEELYGSKTTGKLKTF